MASDVEAACPPTYPRAYAGFSGSAMTDDLLLADMGSPTAVVSPGSNAGPPPVPGPGTTLVAPDVFSGSRAVLLPLASSLFMRASRSFIDIPAHKRHQVEWTDPAQHTVWLGVRYG